MALEVKKMSKLINAVSRIGIPLSWQMHHIAGSTLIVMMFLAVADVIGRYLFNKPIYGAGEIIEFLLVILISLGLAYCTVVKGHVRMDILVGPLPQRVRALFDACTGFISVGILLSLIWGCYLRTTGEFVSWKLSPTLHVATFPFNAIIVLGFILFFLVLLTDFLNSVYEVFRK